MLINDTINSNKTEILINEYAKLLNAGISADNILVLVQNSKKKEEFIQKTKSLLKIDALTRFNVYTFFGLVYNTVLENWCLVENKLTGNARITPILSGLEASQYIFRHSIDEVQFKGYNSKGNLLHQLLRRYSLCVLNALNEEEIKEKSRILLDPFFSDIKKALELYKKKTIDLRAFDYLRQTDIFAFIYKNIQNRYKYVILDDGDEITPALFQYLSHIKPDVKEFFIAYDKFGCTRKGFLAALEYNFEGFTGEKAIAAEKTNKEKSEKALSIFTSVKANRTFKLENIKIESFIREDEMVKKAVETINLLLADIKKRIKPSDIAIVTPNIDNCLKVLLEKIKAPLNYLSGSEKLTKDPDMAGFMEVLNIINNKNLRISPYTLRGISAKILGLDFKTSIQISSEYDTKDEEIFALLKKYEEFESVKKFLELVEEITPKLLSEQLYALAKEYAPRESIYKVNQLLKQIRDFEAIFGENVSKKELLCQLENTIVSENPITSGLADKNAITVSTAQKLIDNSISSKYTFLLDTTNSNWAKQDIGPLYNAWVFQKSWKKPVFELEDNIQCALDKTARILRKLYLLNEGEIFVYSSVYDFLGIENFKGINHFFEAENPENTEALAKKEFKITPRPDQAPVLAYKNGKMAVSAVAGAGKTTIMLALILKLLKDGIPSENIFVLTFMDSAARNFKERIKENFPNLVELPHISTIHGLALRILRENNNHAKLGLDVDFEILDETKRSAIIREIICTAGFEAKKSEIYERAISAYKNQKHPSPDRMTPLFKRVYEEYRRTLLSDNLIDYDDLLALSLTLLRQDEGVRSHYQNLMKFVIEDEAQDSSEVQQELIRILTEKNGNLIRTGDVNQAITTTFSNADVKGFKRFIKENSSVKMNYSNRNATGIIDFANELIKSGQNNAPEAFLAVETKPVAGKNIVDKNAVETKIFDTSEEERAFVLKKIKEILNADRGANIGVLLRSNRAVTEWYEFLSANTDAKIETNSDTLSLNPVFNAVLAVLNFLNDPISFKNVEECAKTLYSLGFYRQEFSIFQFLKTCKTPFILGENEDWALYWDLKYFVSLWNCPILEVAYKIGEFYFANNPVQSANIPMVSGIVAKIFATQKTFEDTVQKLNSIATKTNKTGIRLVSSAEDSRKSGAIQVMTIHKSKGDEYDCVFLPEMTTDNLGMTLSDIKISENSKFIESVKSDPKTPEALKKETLEENYRLAYVGVTRAKKKLYISSALSYEHYKRLKPANPNQIFDIAAAKGGLS